MKIILLFSLFLTSLFAYQTQIVLGTYSKYASAKYTQAQLNKIIEKDIKFKKFLEKNNVESIVKKSGKYYVVIIKPFYDLVTQNAVLSKIKKTNFSDAYILKVDSNKKIIKKQTPIIETVILEDNDPVLATEPDIKNIPIQTKPKATVKKVIKTPLKQKAITTKNENIVAEYFNEIKAFLAILIISIIYLFVTKNKHKNEKDIVEQIKSKDEKIKDEKIVVSEEKTLKLNENSEILNAENNNDSPMIMQETNEINFDAVNEFNITSDTVKKKVKHHAKRRKDDFKDFKGCRIMIAEDNIINQKVVTGLLSTSGIQIEVMDDGLEVIEYLKNDNDFCIILMDANMPNMDGYEATRIIRKNKDYSHITVVALSGDIAQDDIKKMKNAGMQEHLEKPLKMDALYDILAAYSFKKRDAVELDEIDIDIKNQQELYTDIGLEVCGGDEEFYKEILSDFTKDCADSTSKIQNFLNTNKFIEADKLLLDISGVAANIGAINLQNLVKELKLNLKTPEDREYIHMFKKYAKHYEALEKEVKEYLTK